MSHSRLRGSQQPTISLSSVFVKSPSIPPSLSRAERGAAGSESDLPPHTSLMLMGKGSWCRVACMSEFTRVYMGYYSRENMRGAWACSAVGLENVYCYILIQETITFK